MTWKPWKTSGNPWNLDNPMSSNDSQKKNSAQLERILSWVVTVLVPVALSLAAVRVVMTPALLHFEYNQPNFPTDSYGFTIEDRLYWSQIALDYLLNPADISFLGDLRFEDGTPVYNASELRHMVDVKDTVRNAMNVWYLSLAVLLMLGIWARRGSWWDEYRLGLARGGWLTVILIGSVILFVLLSFGVLFVAFHNVFFEPGTWKFLFSDTLIRLFPQRFWQDLFLIVGGLSLVGGLALGLGLRRKA